MRLLQCTHSRAMGSDIIVYRVQLSGDSKSAAMVLKHGPLTQASIPGLAPAFPQGMGAVVLGVVFKKMEVAASTATNQILRVMFRLGMGFMVHSSLRDFFRPPFHKRIFALDMPGSSDPISPGASGSQRVCKHPDTPQQRRTRNGNNRPGPHRCNFWADHPIENSELLGSLGRLTNCSTRKMPHGSATDGPWPG